MEFVVFFTSISLFFHFLIILFAFWRFSFLLTRLIFCDIIFTTIFKRGKKVTVRIAKREDLARVHFIYMRAREFMKETGNPTQWGDAYPSEELIEEDLANKRLCVIEDSDTSEIHGVFAFFASGDAIYNNIEGTWLNDLPHSAIHRVASSGERRGILAACVEFCLSQSKNLKIDTHPDNKIMQYQLQKAGFSLCGTITMPDGSPRLAYQLFIS